MASPTFQLENLITVFRPLRTVCSAQVPMSNSEASFSVSPFSTTRSINLRFTFGPSDEICRKRSLSSSLTPDIKAFWISVVVAPTRNLQWKYLVSTFYCHYHKILLECPVVFFAVYFILFFFFFKLLSKIVKYGGIFISSINFSLK